MCGRTENENLKFSYDAEASNNSGIKRGVSGIKEHYSMVETISVFEDRLIFKFKDGTEREYML